jgi:Uma2 family endonuclease
MNQSVVLTCSGDEYLARRDWADYELADGVLVPRHTGGQTGEISAMLGRLIGLHCREQRIGRVFGVKAPYRCFPDRPDTVRRPSLSVIRVGRLHGEIAPKGFLTLPPDLAVEVVSPNDLYEEVETKVAEYRSAGVRLVWVVSPSAKTVVVRRLDGTCAEVGEAGELSGEDIVPGFACRVAELFV